MHLFVAVPSHSSSVTTETMRTLLAVQELALRRGYGFQLDSLDGSVISIIRNVLAAAFLQSGADLLLMLDADQGIGGDAIARMIDLDQPVVGCLYPKKVRHWSNVAPGAPVDQMLLQASEFAGDLAYDANGQARVVGGFALADHVGTGVLLVRRQALERIKEKFPELQGRGFGRDVYQWLGDTGRWGFFNPLDSEDGPLAEDISFCRRWREAGGEIWADVTSPVQHVGRQVYEASYLDYSAAIGAARSV